MSVTRSRPILVKLRSSWDKRAILSRHSGLKDFPGRVFIAPDESLETRRLNTLKRLKSRAEHSGKSVVVDDGILSVDVVPVYSLS
jgi:hypothetical protein